MQIYVLAFLIGVVAGLRHGVGAAAAFVIVSFVVALREVVGPRGPTHATIAHTAGPQGAGGAADARSAAGAGLRRGVCY